MWSNLHPASSGIPPGRVSTYGEVAKALGSCARAVGGALRVRFGEGGFAPMVVTDGKVGRG